MPWLTLTTEKRSEQSHGPRPAHTGIGQPEEKGRRRPCVLRVLFLLCTPPAVDGLLFLSDTCFLWAITQPC